MQEHAAHLAHHAIGAMILTFFGSVWLITACLNMSDAGPWAVPAILILALGIYALAMRRFLRHRVALRSWGALPAARRMRRQLMIVNIAQGIAMFAAVNVLANLGLQAWILPALILVVGVHFLPLARMLHAPAYNLTAGALIAIVLIYPTLTAAGPQNPLGAAAAGLVLWATALSRLLPLRAGYSAAV